MAADLRSTRQLNEINCRADIFQITLEIAAGMSKPWHLGNTKAGDSPFRAQLCNCSLASGAENVKDEKSESFVTDPRGPDGDPDENC